MDSIMDQRILTRFRRISGALGIFVAALGALVLFGWALDIHVVKDAVPSIGTTMKPNTALGFILSGVALNLLTRTRLPWTRYANLALALGVISIGAFTLLEYATGWNLHIDELLFREHLNALETLPGRMSTVTASTFVLAGMALFFIEDEQRPGFRFAQFSAVLIGVVAFLVSTGYLYGVAALYGAKNHAQIALHTAIAFVALSNGLLFARPGAGWMKVVSSSTGAGELFRRMAPAIFLAPLLLGWLTLAGEKSGLYRTEFEVSLMVVGSAVSLLGLLWMASDHLFHLEGKRRQVHQAMEASEEDLAITLQSIGDAVITTDPDGRVTRMNPVAERLTGWTLAEAKGLLLSQVFQIVSEDTREHLEDPASRVLREGVVVGLANHTLLLAKDGREISLSDSGAPIRGEDGKIRGVVLVFRDMTEERAAEEALRRSESSSRLLFEGNPLPMWVYDLETLAFLLVNDAAVANYGYSREEFLSMKIPDIRPQEDAQRLQEVLQGERSVIEHSKGWRHVLKDGRVIDVEIDSHIVAFEGRKAALVVARDVTGRMRAEKALQQREAALIEAQRLAKVGSWERDLTRDVIYWSDEMYRFYDRDPSLPPPSFQEASRFFMPESWERLKSAYERTFATGEPYQQDAELSRLDEHGPHWVTVRGEVIRSPDGGITGLRGTLQDITERKRAEAEIRKLNAELEEKVAARTADLEGANAALANREEEIRSVVDHMADCVITIDEMGVIRSANPALESVFGYANDELIGKNISLLMPEPEHSAHDGYIERYCRTGESRVIGVGREVEGVDKSGERIAMELSISEYSVHGQRYFTGILRDIRERVRIMADLQQARQDAEQASRAKSDFLAAMSHEIRTPMNGVIGMVDVLHQTSLKGYQVEMVDLIRESAFSLLTIIDDILDFSKIEAGKLEIDCAPTQIAEVMESVCAMLERLAEKKGVELTLFTDPAIPNEVLGDGLRLRQVLINLANNAIKFSSGQGRQGRVSVRALLVRQDPDQVIVEFQVADNGIGMDESTQKRLFKSFAQADTSTTRRFGGTGLGLAISRQLVELMDGEIAVRSSAGLGSTFTARLAFVPRQGSPDPGAHSSLVGGLSCLVVGGRETLAGDMAAYLESAGAVAEKAEDLISAEKSAARLTPGLWVLVMDMATETPSPSDLRAIFRDRPDIECRLVVIGHGEHHHRRRPRLEEAGLVTVDGNLLTCRAILKAVAIAAGRMEEDKESPLADKQDAAPLPPTRSEALERGMLILIAEDNETNQKVILQQMALLGLAADVAIDGREALERWKSGDYAMLLTDLHMPHMDGYELTAAIRTEEQGARRIPIIAMTANALKGEGEHCRAVGMDDYLSKPTPLVVLKTMLETWLPAKAGKGLDPPSVPPPLEGPVDLSVLEALVGDAPETIREILDDFRMSEAEIAAQLRTACVSGQALQAGAAAHKLKASARAVGALALGDLCDEIEKAGRAGEIEVLAMLLPSFDSEMAAVEKYLNSIL